MRSQAPHPSQPPRRFFDNAATSFPKPPAVAEAMARFMGEVGAPGRGGYAEAREAGRILRVCRERINRLIGGENPDHIVFTLNATDALNLAIKGVTLHAEARGGKGRGGPHAVITTMEHNSVLRPINALADSGVLEVTRVAADPASGLVDPGDIAAAVRSGQTVLVAVNHASNVTGSIQSVTEIGRECRRRGGDDLVFLVDAAQSLGHIPVDVRAKEIDLLAFPGHKGLLGPQGTGGLYIRPGVEKRMCNVREGGTGNQSELDRQPEVLPERFEAGSHNAVGIAGLSEGVAWLLQRGIAGPGGLMAHEAALIREMLSLLASDAIPGLRLLGTAPPDRRVGVFSVVHPALEPAELAAVLETEFGILTRAGLHCAPLVHQAMGTAPPRGNGAVRLSLGPFLAIDDVRAAAEALAAAVSARAA